MDGAVFYCQASEGKLRGGATAADENGFKQYQALMEDCSEAEKRFLLDTLGNLKINMRVLMCDNRP